MVAEESLKNFSKAIEIKKNYAEAHNNKGVLLNQMGRFKEASEEFNKAITIRPYYAAAYKGQGDILIDLGKYEEGIQNYSKALDLKPDFTDAKIKENYDSILETILKEKPSGIKGDFILSAFLTSTMGVSYKLKIGK